MKQAISTDQLKELSDKGLTNYKAYLKDKYADVIDYIVLGDTTKTVDVTDMDVEQLPLLSIGQLIEFLGEKDQITEITAMQEILKKREYWLVDANLLGEFEHEELVDALFQPVKEILEA